MNTPHAPLYKRGVAALVALALAIGASAANAQTQTYTSLAGAWWFSIAGKDKGAIVLKFTEPVSGQFAVRDITPTDRASFGFSTGLGEFFVINPGPAQTLSIDSKGQISGKLVLTLADGNDPAGEIVVEKGKPNKAFTKLKLHGTIAGVGGSPLKVALKGVRVPDDFPVLSGENTEARLTGKGVKSKAYQLTVRGDTELGLPAYGFTGTGPAEIDKVEVSNVLMRGRMMLDPKKRVFGLLDDSTDFGTGSLKGKLLVPGSGTVPKVDLKIEADRKVRTYALLVEPVEPVLEVTPTSYNFGGVRLDEMKEQVFQVRNVGVGLLSGEATFLSGSSGDFAILGESSYFDLEPNDPPFEIRVAFDPSSTSDKTAQLYLSVAGGAGAKTVELRGSGGVPELEVVPEAHAFGNVVLNTPAHRTFTVTNNGDGVLNGTAIISGATMYELALTDDGAAVNAIEYTIDPGDFRVIRVRFTPTSTGQHVGTLIFDGDVDETVPLTGTGVTGGPVVP